MQPFTPYTIENNQFLLSTGRCLFWENEKTLILSDLHLGKTGHFRKAGIAVPQAIFKEDMQRLLTQLHLFKPKEIIVIGDMFHSTDNKEHDLFLKWRKDLATISIHLVKGNHDILEDAWYKKAQINIHHTQLKKNGLVFTHDIEDCELPGSGYVFSGHIHPGITINGIGKQSLRFPCFYFGKQYAVLPAFSRFTGTHGIRTKKGDTVFALVENNLLQVQ